MHHDKKVAFIKVDEDGTLARSSEFMRTCHNMNIIVQITVVDASSLNGKIKPPNKTLDDTTGDFLLRSSHKKELWCLPYQYTIWIFFRYDNMLWGDGPYSLSNGSRPSYKKNRICGEIFYIINGRVTRKKPDDISHRVYFMGFASTKRVIINWNLCQPFYIDKPHHALVLWIKL